METTERDNERERLAWRECVMLLLSSMLSAVHSLACWLSQQLTQRHTLFTTTRFFLSFSPTYTSTQ